MEEIFDRQALLHRVEGDEELLEEMLVIFLEFTPKQLQEIGLAIETGDASVLHGRAHSIRGAAASISAKAVQQAAGQLEQAGQEHDLEQATQAFKALTQEFPVSGDLRQQYIRSSAPMAVTSEGTAGGLAPEPVLVVDDDPVQHALVGKYLQNRPVVARLFRL